MNSEQIVVPRKNAVTVPGLTFENAAICIPSELREYLEQRQRALRRQALGCHVRVDNELVKGDVGGLPWRHERPEASCNTTDISGRWMETAWQGISSSTFTRRMSACRGGSELFGLARSLASSPWTLNLRLRENGWLHCRYELLRHTVGLLVCANIQSCVYTHCRRRRVGPLTLCGNTLGGRLLIKVRGGAPHT